MLYDGQDQGDYGENGQGDEEVLENFIHLSQGGYFSILMY